MKNNATELVFILDRSGSMAGLESDTVGGFNAMLEKQKQQDGEAFVTTVLFDHEITTLHDRVKLAEVAPLTDRDYTVRGCTALLDAIGQTVEHIKNVHRYIRPEDVPEKTVFVITTDGLENASKEYSTAAVKKLIEQQQACGWEFLFLGANIDAVQTAASFGIAPERAANYHADRKGTKTVYKAVAEAVCGLRAGKCVPREWSAEISEDFNSRDSER
ncbi:MAG: VWA domain-containing protein [Oscillospiraceae bacterium]|nr:VWA domain-containing protein [Oscillospiraceae bacterium]